MFVAVIIINIVVVVVVRLSIKNQTQNMRLTPGMINEYWHSLHDECS